MLYSVPAISASLMSQLPILKKKKKVARLPTVTHVAGYCAHAALKKLCQSCKENLVMDDAGVDIGKNVLFMSVTRGGLKFQCELVANAVLTTEIVLDKLRSPRFQPLLVKALTSIGRPQRTYIHLIPPMWLACCTRPK